MSDEMEKFGNERETDGKLKTIISFIKSGLTTLEAVKASGQASPSELEKIEAALAKN